MIPTKVRITFFSNLFVQTPFLLQIRDTLLKADKIQKIKAVRWYSDDVRHSEQAAENQCKQHIKIAQKFGYF